MDAGWTLSYSLVGGRDRPVRVGEDALAPGQSATFSLTGAHSPSDPPPTDFAMNERPCAATVVTPAATTVSGEDDPPRPGDKGNKGNGKGHSKGKDKTTALKDD